jgi:hypothetical protein
MCDPLIGGILGVVGSIASAGINYAQQSSVMKQQQAANDQWVAYQRQQAQEEMARDEANRQKAANAAQATQQQISAPEQKQQQQTEETRLTTQLMPKDLQDAAHTGQIPGDILLSGQQNSAAPVQQAIAGQINDATQAARQRIAALATIQSYGGSQFGLQNTVNQAFQTGNQGIDLSSNFRRGDLSAYGAAKNVEPLHIVATPSPWGGIANALAGVAGKAFGGGGFGGGGGVTNVGTFGSDMSIGSF